MIFVKFQSLRIMHNKVTYGKYLKCRHSTYERIFVMKKKIVCILLFLFASALAVAAVAAPLSPSLEIIATEYEMLKSAPVHEDVKFTKEDFVLSAGADIKSITVTSLPPAGDGALMLGSSKVNENQTISASNLDLLRFVPSEGTSASSFRFTCDRSYTTECMISILDRSNSAPVSGGDEVAPVWTQCDVSCFGTMKGKDPDGDKISFEITKFPTEGLLDVTDKTSGNYIYTPYSGFCGVDSFSYRIKDEYGSYSDEYKVTVKIDKRVTETALNDMDGHWAQNAAMVMVSDGIMDVINENGMNYFDPDEVISREDFLVSVMKAFGAGDLSPRKTSFSDDEEISERAGGYVAAAQKLGVVKGEHDNGGLLFRPKQAITQAEAAAILNRIIGADSNETVEVFADSNSSPAWAASDISALSSLGIVSCFQSDSTDASSPVSRAQTAQALMTAKFLFDVE